MVDSAAFGAAVFGFAGNGSLRHWLTLAAPFVMVFDLANFSEIHF